MNKELLKGNIDTMILAMLVEQNRYGYELSKAIRERSQGLFDLKESTLYLALKRLEHNGSISSYWSEEQGAGGRRKYYEMLPAGRADYKHRCQQWERLRQVMDQFMGGMLDEG